MAKPSTNAPRRKAGSASTPHSPSIIDKGLAALVLAAKRGEVGSGEIAGTKGEERPRGSSEWRARSRWCREVSKESRESGACRGGDGEALLLLRDGGRRSFTVSEGTREEEGDNDEPAGDKDCAFVCVRARTGCDGKGGRWSARFVFLRRLC